MFAIKQPRIIVVTGAESTGKSELTRQLGAWFSAPLFPEYAREYLEKSDVHYTREDVEKIAIVQKRQMESALTLKTGLVIFDTWLIITKVWFEVVYGEAPFWIHEAIVSAPVGLFLLCDTDLPWEADPLRENGGEMRNILSEKYRKNLLNYEFNFRTVTGHGEKRLQHALQIIREWL
jgi:nicotinamide riboside kinase